MNPFDEWRRQFTNFLLNLGVICVSVPVIEPVLRGANVSDANPLLTVSGLGAAFALNCFAAILLFYGPRR